MTDHTTVNKNIKDEETPDMPTLIVCAVGHVADGKSTIVKYVSKKVPQQHSRELAKGKTIKLGYANAKIFKCNICPEPSCYDSDSSSIKEKYCQKCNTQMKMVKHISFLDCPGHHDLTATTLSGSCIVDYSMLVESIANKNIPAPQTWEHMTATQMVGIENAIICLNKIDTLKLKSKVGTMEKLQQNVKRLKEFTGEYEKSSDIVIPTSAIFGMNMDVVLQKLANLKEIERDLTLPPKMVCVRSFDINKPKELNEKAVKQLHGGALGGSLQQGKLKVGDVIKITPGHYECSSTEKITVRKSQKNESGKREKVELSYKNWKCYPIVARVLSMKSETENIQTAIPGGLVGIQLDIDPGLAKSDKFAGNVITLEEDKEITVSAKIMVEIKEYFPDYQTGTRKDFSLDAGDKVKFHVNSDRVSGTIMKFNKKDNTYRIFLDKPVSILENTKVVMSEYGTDSILAVCNIIDSQPCEMH